MLPRQFPGRAASGNGGGRARASLFLLLTACVALLFIAGPVLSAEIIPFYTQNQSPLVQIFGLPAAGNAVVVPPGHGEGMLALDVASNFAKQSNAGSGETILLDGESYRTTLVCRYGITKGVEGGIELPVAAYGGGFLDGFIIGWHSFFQLPQGGRKEAPHNRLLYTYSRNGQELLHIDDSSVGVGDLRLTGGVQLYNDGKRNPRALALRASLKLPTGDSARLLGSGSTDFALWLTGSDDYGFPAWGHLTVFAAVGGMGLSDGDVLQGQQRNLAGFGTIGFGWSPAEVIAFKTQLSGHTPFYRGSELRELNYNALQLLIGGTIAFSGATALDIGVSEDLAVNTSPDVAFHLALSRRF